MYRLSTIIVFGAIATLVTSAAPAQDKNDRTIAIADGKFQLTAPEGWVRKQPRTRIVEHEFAAPKVEGDQQDGRLTVMPAGGSVEANIDRWIGQFTQPNGSNTKERAKTEKKIVAGQTVHTVDISGTYKDSPGPFVQGQAVEREKYRMIGAVIETQGGGNYFLKFYGPEKTIEKNAAAFRELVDSLGKLK